MPQMHNHLLPAILIHPGEILKEELAARGLSQKDLAQKTGRPPQTISLIINGRKGISEETAIDLEDAFGGEISTEFWMNIETHYRFHKERLKRRERKAS